MRARIQPVLDKLASLPAVWRRLWQDRRWIMNTKISVALWTLNFGLFYIGVTTFTRNTWLMNFVLSLGWDMVWYFINRFYLWDDRKVSTGSSAGHATLVWLLTFGVNQFAFYLFVGQAGIDWYIAKPVLTLVSASLAVGRFLYNDNQTFAEKIETA